MEEMQKTQSQYEAQKRENELRQKAEQDRIEREKSEMAA